jgi:general secretion pathway protein A
LRQLKQRLVIQATISPLTDKESLEYIAHRLAKVRLTDAPIFTRGALRQIIKYAKGTPRVLNILCSSALIQGFGERQHHISARIAQQVIADYRGKRSHRRWRLWMALTGATALLTAWFLFSPYPHIVWSKIDYTGLLKHTPANITQSIASHSSTRMPPPQETTEAPRDSVPPLLKSIRALPPEISKRDAPTTPTEVSEPTQAQAAPVTVRMVQRGDQIAKLALEVYGTASPAVLKWIMKNNPQLRSVNRIESGMQLTLPPLPPGVR